MRTNFLIVVFWFLASGLLAAQPITVADLLRLTALSPAAFEQEMTAKGHTCYQRKKTLTNWSCLFMDQRPVYLNQPALAQQVTEYVFGPKVTLLIYQIKSTEAYAAWHNQLLLLGFLPDSRPQSNESVGRQYTREQVSVVLRKVDIYNGVSTNLTGYSATITWMRQTPLLTQEGQLKQRQLHAQ